WGVARLGDLVSRMANGCVYTPDEKNGVPITRIETISDGTINWNRIGHAKPSPEIESYKIQHGDILYSHINSIDHIGKVARYSDCKPLYHGMNLILLRPNSNIDSDFLFFLLSSETIRRIARTLAKQAVSQASINTKELRALELTIPDVGEQIAVASTLSDMDAELAALESRRDKARQLKQGMMQELLSGRIRLA
ncbi:restriction endonuclease subunit S, partial [Halopseudomonas pachastrellae]